MKKIVKCEICGNINLDKVLDLGLHPLCDDLVKTTENRKCIEYPIDILFCRNCYTAHQKFQVPKQNLFKKNYHYRARMTGSVLTGMSDLVNSIEKKIGPLKNKNCLDIGCNDGSLLNFFKKKGCKTMGVEPTSAARDCKHKVINKFFDKKVARQIKNSNFSPDIITFTNVFAHIENLNELIDNLKIVISPSTILVIENHYLGSVLKYGQFDTFYHEHPRTYSLKSFRHISKILNMKLFDVEFVSRYGGNIRAYLGNNIPEKKITKKEIDYKKLFLKMKRDMLIWKKETKKFIINHVKKNGKFKAKAFPGRAAILLKLINIDSDVMPIIFEKKGSMKLDHYAPGTKIKIDSDELWMENKEVPEVLIIWAWHIHEEISGYLRKAGYRGRLFTPLPVFKEIL